MLLSRSLPPLSVCLPNCCAPEVEEQKFFNYLAGVVLHIPPSANLPPMSEVPKEEGGETITIRVKDQVSAKSGELAAENPRTGELVLSLKVFPPFFDSLPPVLVEWGAPNSPPPTKLRPRRYIRPLVPPPSRPRVIARGRTGEQNGHRKSAEH